MAGEDRPAAKVTRFLLDSGIASDLINRRGLVPQRVREARLRGDRIGLGTPVLAELVLASKTPTILNGILPRCGGASDCLPCGRSTRKRPSNSEDCTLSCG